MQVGDTVRSAVDLPQIPAGAVGTVREIGRLFVVVGFADGRIAYYAPRQLCVCTGAPDDQAAAYCDCEAIALGFAEASVPPGSHICLLPSSPEEDLALSARFFAEGLRAGDLCSCIASPSWAQSLRRVIAELTGIPRRAVESENMVFLDTKEVYLQGDEFTVDRQMAQLERVVGLTGRRPARALGRIGRVVQGIPGEHWWEYERRATALLKEAGVTAVCSYRVGDPGGRQWQRAHAVHPYVVENGQLLAGGAAA